MNKKDLVLITIIISIAFIFILYFSTKKQSDIALVYYKDDIILTIDLNINNIYEVNGELGKIKIEVNNSKIKVIEENSPYHLCSKQGYISKQGESIVCLPNKIIIKLPNSQIDTEVS